MSKRVRHEGAQLADIEAVYRSRFCDFLQTAVAIVGDADAARDAVQEAFAKAVRARSDFRGKGTLEGWLWRILVNTARDTRPPARSPFAEVESAAWNGGHRDVEEMALRVVLARLPERQRLVVFLRYFADLDHARIAEALDIRPGTVAATLNHAHASLRRQLEEVLP
jgi:RNA polymerase sigma-70 factor (ECF subfamily)